jgi:nucleoside-diphosphate-sugar epimerase
MKVLFIGGTGNISESVSRLALSQGIDLHLLNRGKRGVSIPDAKTVTADINDAAAVRSALGKTTYDAVVNWIAFTPTEVERDIALFAGRTAQYIFISSASVYQKPATSYLITESTPLANPYWEYSRNKIACEERLMAEYRANGFPFTTVRPSLTYGARLIPLAINSWGKSYTIVGSRGQGICVLFVEVGDAAMLVLEMGPSGSVSVSRKQRVFDPDIDTDPDPDDPIASSLAASRDLMRTRYAVGAVLTHRWPRRGRN